MSEGEIWIKLFGLASLIISESFPLMWKFNVPELNFGNATCSISMSPATGSLLLCVEVLNLPCFSAALLETAKVLVFLLSLVFHVFGVLISLWLHTNAAGLPKGWKLHISLLRTCATFLVSYRKHLHLEWPGLQGISANQIETYAPSCGRLAGSSQKVPQNNSCHQFVPCEMVSHHLIHPD